MVTGIGRHFEAKEDHDHRSDAGNQEGSRWHDFVNSHSTKSGLKEALHPEAEAAQATRQLVTAGNLPNLAIHDDLKPSRPASDKKAEQKAEPEIPTTFLPIFPKDHQNPYPKGGSFPVQANEDPKRIPNNGDAHTEPYIPKT